MKFVNLNKPGKWLITLAVLFSFLFGTLLENRLQMVQNFQNAVENVNAVILPAGNKIKERFDAYYKKAEKTYDAFKIGTAISMAIILSSLPKANNRGP
ncbi:hypothetical protein [Desulforamulus putei]|uniref:Uncharacterized protein n=1 Tax=Desulforamulus putei DSM 12395 TaxID=1121429 RepID=A0A1M4YYJ2_9FIRM|nr:hypothetical protein [Desulforamulus putei]SHF10873.1 hypothetical protein SAMN02745133_01827 [Desulforamulus putei DSM 12395]